MAQRNNSTSPARKSPSPKSPTRPASRVAKSGNPAAVRRATPRDWIDGARLRTLPLAIAPVALGTATAYAATGYESWAWPEAALCLAVALFLQIGVNFANDYSDGVRGTDRHRVGPSRLTGSGSAKPRTVLTVALVFFGLAAAAGVAVVVLSGHWWLLAVGAAALAAGWFYTGGKRPYGYHALGEVFVFVFFGLVATAGTTYVQADRVTTDTWLAGIAAGLFACAVLVANNLRDREQDAVAGKRTLTVLIGDLPSRILYVVLILAPFGILLYFALLNAYAKYVYFALLLAIPLALIAITAKSGKELLLLLKLTSLLALAFALGLAAAIVF